MSQAIGLGVIADFALGFAIFGTTTCFTTLGGIVTGTLVLSDLLTHAPLGTRGATHGFQKSIHPLLVRRTILKGRVHQMLFNLFLHPFLLVPKWKQCKQLRPEHVMSFDLIRSRFVGLVLSHRGEKVRTGNHLDLFGGLAQEPRLILPDDLETRIRTGIPNLFVRFGLITQLLVHPIVKVVQPMGGVPNTGMQRQLLFHELGGRSPALLAGQNLLDGIKKQLLVPENYGVLAFGLMMGNQMQ